MDIEKYLTEREEAYKNFVRTIMATTPFKQLNGFAESVVYWFYEKLGRG